MSFTDHFWVCPAGVTSIIAECWASGGGGRIGQGDTIPGSGGGGGAYARGTLSVTPTVTYNGRTGDPGPANSGGDDSIETADGGFTVLAFKGAGGTFGAPGAGGPAGSCIGDFKFSGGDGGPFPGFVSSDGTGGGSSGGTASGGNTGATPTGGAAPFGGGAGGSGGTGTGDGAAGASPGGGGGGGSGNPGSVNPTNPGVGGNGAVRIWNALDGSYPYGTPLSIGRSENPGL